MDKNQRKSKNPSKQTFIFYKLAGNSKASTKRKYFPCLFIFLFILKIHSINCWFWFFCATRCCEKGFPDIRHGGKLATKEANAFICLLLWGVSTASPTFYKVTHFCLETYCFSRFQTIFLGEAKVLSLLRMPLLSCAVFWSSVMGARSIAISAGWKVLEIEFVTTSPDSSVWQWLSSFNKVHW